MQIRQSVPKSAEVLKVLQGKMLDYEYKGLWQTSEEEQRALKKEIETKSPEHCLFRFLAQISCALRMDVHSFLGFTADGKPSWIRGDSSLPAGAQNDTANGALLKVGEYCVNLAAPVQIRASKEETRELAELVATTLGKTVNLVALPIYTTDGHDLLGLVFLTHPVSVPPPTALEWNLALFYLVERLTPLQILFDTHRLPCVPQSATLSPIEGLTSALRCVSGLSKDNLNSHLGDAVQRNTMTGVATWLNQVATLVGYRDPYPFHLEHLFSMIEFHSTRRDAEAISRTSSQSADDISEKASRQPWVQTLPMILSTMATTIQQTPTVYWVVANVEELQNGDHVADGVRQFTIQHNPGVPDPSGEEFAAISALAHWAAITGNHVYIDPAKSYGPHSEVGPLVAPLRGIFGAESPIVAIPVYNFVDSTFTDDKKAVFHGVFVALRDSNAVLPSTEKRLMWAMTAQYLLKPLATAKFSLKTNYRPVEILRAVKRTQQCPMALIVPSWVRL